ncbi:ACP S-malonyltransferase [Altericista sp. CCNU0014]|uniref:ACP S-malonyltransferase n=1 Tax=Altericista sp. CCNU0014 TaxID=3082949 RepID=UPI00384F38BF
MTKTAWVFPGQGSQLVGMGVDLLETAIARERYHQAEEILGWSILDCCKGELEILSQTLYTQPCLYVISAILTDLLREKGCRSAVMAGHSLGEYAALYAAGTLDFRAGLKLVQRRAELMDDASGGKMVAVMGFDRDAIDAAVAAIPDVVLANDNHADQIVISGSPTAVDALLASVKIKRSVPLKVSGAFHSPLMAQASQEFSEVLQSVLFRDAQVPVIANVEPTPATDAATLQERLMQQMTGPVRWREICLALTEMGVEEVIEVGPGKVLTGLVKRTCPGMKLTQMGTLANLAAYTSADSCVEVA